MAEVLLDPRSRKAQNQFLNQVDMMIDWRPIRTLINKKYTKKQTDAAGAPTYDVIVLFKMMLLQTWYELSDCALEERINDSLSFSRFLGLPVEAVSPDHSTLSRFRTALTKLGLMDKLLDALNKPLKKYHVSIMQGTLVDASVVDTLHPEGSPDHRGCRGSGGHKERRGKGSRRGVPEVDHEPGKRHGCRSKMGKEERV